MTTSTVPALVWRKSTYSNADGNCIEVAAGSSVVAVRDSKDRAGPVLTFGAPEWCEFLENVRNRQFDLG